MGTFATTFAYESLVRLDAVGEGHLISNHLDAGDTASRHPGSALSKRWIAYSPGPERDFPGLGDGTPFDRWRAFGRPA